MSQAGPDPSTTSVDNVTSGPTSTTPEAVLLVSIPAVDRAPNIGCDDRTSDSGSVSSASAPADVPTLPHWLRTIRLVLLCAYGAAYLAWFLKFGVIIDRVSVSISITVFLVIGHIGKPLRTWLRLPFDLALYSVMWFAYDETRGAADRLGMPLQVESVRNIDRLLFLGADPTVWLQRRLYSPQHVGVLDVIASIEYFSHFVVPIAVIAVLWVTNRSAWARFMRRFATVLAIACAMFIVLPTAPPWMAAGGDSRIRLDALAPLHRIAGRGWRHIGLEGFVHTWDLGRDWANPVAAMPSLHAAFALFVVAFYFPMIHRRWLRVLLCVHPLLMAFALVYTAEHYVADVLAGWLLVGLSFWMWARIERWWCSRNRVNVLAPTAPGPLTVAGADCRS